MKRLAKLVQSEDSKHTNGGAIMHTRLVSQISSQESFRLTLVQSVRKLMWMDLLKYT